MLLNILLLAGALVAQVASSAVALSGYGVSPSPTTTTSSASLVVLDLPLAPATTTTATFSPPIPGALNGGLFETTNLPTADKVKRSAATTTTPYSLPAFVAPLGPGASLYETTDLPTAADVKRSAAPVSTKTVTITIPSAVAALGAGGLYETTDLPTAQYPAEPRTLATVVRKRADASESGYDAVVTLILPAADTTTSSATTFSPPIPGALNGGLFETTALPPAAPAPTAANATLAKRDGYYLQTFNGNSCDGQAGSQATFQAFQQDALCVPTENRHSFIVGGADGASFGVNLYSEDNCQGTPVLIAVSGGACANVNTGGAWLSANPFYQSG